MAKNKFSFAILPAALALALSLASCDINDAEPSSGIGPGGIPGNIAFDPGGTVTIPGVTLPPGAVGGAAGTGSVIIPIWGDYITAYFRLPTVQEAAVGGITPAEFNIINDAAGGGAIWHIDEFGGFTMWWLGGRTIVHFTGGVRATLTNMGFTITAGEGGGGPWLEGERTHGLFHADFYPAGSPPEFPAGTIILRFHL